jgi:hypothetical protein
MSVAVLTACSTSSVLVAESSAVSRLPSEREVIGIAIELADLPEAQLSLVAPEAYRRVWGWEVIIPAVGFDEPALYVVLSDSGDLLCPVSPASLEPPMCKRDW